MDEKLKKLLSIFQFVSPSRHRSQFPSKRNFQWQIPCRRRRRSARAVCECFFLLHSPALPISFIGHTRHIRRRKKNDWSICEIDEQAYAFGIDLKALIGERTFRTPNSVCHRRDKLEFNKKKKENEYWSRIETPKMRKNKFNWNFLFAPSMAPIHMQIRWVNESTEFQFSIECEITAHA